MLTPEILAQLENYLTLLTTDVSLSATLAEDENSRELLAFLEEVAALSPLLHVQKSADLTRVPAFSLVAKGQERGIRFAGVPSGHEFSSFVLALLQVGGHPPKISEAESQQIKAINDPLNFETFVDLACVNCPDVVQALNAMAVLNPLITHETIVGDYFAAEAERRHVFSTPTTFLNGELFSTGRVSLAGLLAKLAPAVESEGVTTDAEKTFDVLVIGGGPSGASTALELSRQNLQLGLIAPEIGGNLQRESVIENFLGTPYITGEKLKAKINAQISRLPLHHYKNQAVSFTQNKDQLIVTLDDGTNLTTKVLVLAVGQADQMEPKIDSKQIFTRQLPEDLVLKGKTVALSGSNNAAFYQALALTAKAKQVVLLLTEKATADQVLQERAAQTINLEITSEKAQFTAADYQIIMPQTRPATEWLSHKIALTQNGEIMVDQTGLTNVAGIFAVGSCTNRYSGSVAAKIGAGAECAAAIYRYLHFK